MKNSNFSRLKLAAVLVAFVCACALFTGCGPKPEKEKPVVDYVTPLVGTWKSEFTGGYDQYTITAEKVTYESVFTGYDPYTWEGSLVKATDSYIYVKKSDNKYYCTAYKNLTAQSCSLADAYKADGKTNAETLEDAKSEFTVENGYFNKYGEYKKQ